MHCPTPVATGMDISDRFSHLCTIDASGEVVETARIRTTPEGVGGYFGGRSKMHVVLEVGTHARWVAELLVEHGHEVLVANARKVRAIYENENKDDRVDAEMLARLRRLDPSLLQPVDVLERNLADLAVVRARDRLVQARNKLVNCVRATVKTTGQRLPTCDADTFHRRRGELPEPLHVALLPVMDAIEVLTTQIQRLERVAERACESKYPETARVRQIPGVGPITALAYVLTVGRPERFTDSRRVGSYFGLRPKRDASGESDPSLRITKCGDKLVRRLLVGAAQHILGPFGKQSALRDWGLDLVARGGKAARKKAAVALARKLAVVMHRLWITGDAYQPYPQGEPGPLRMLKAS